MDLTVEDMDSQEVNNPPSIATADSKAKKSRNNSLEKKNRGNTLGASLKMKLEIMLPPEDED